jgi:PhzF family phenazine biosynthesis protein
VQCVDIQLFERLLVLGVSHFVPPPWQTFAGKGLQGRQKRVKKNSPATPVPFCLILHGDFQGQHTKTGKNQRLTRTWQRFGHIQLLESSKTFQKLICTIQIVLPCMRTYIVDAFTKEPFKGNPAGVCFCTEQVSNTNMQAIAKEFGLSETAFVLPADKKGTYAIRYFSPKKEIPLCGHATLASAKVIFKDTGENEVHFITAHGVDIPVKREGEEMIMELPVYDTVDASAPPAMLGALGLTEIIQASYSAKNKIILLEIGDAAVLAGLQPDFNALVTSYNGINGVLVTAPPGNGEYDFHYRYFWPWAGTNEDPVTGGVQTFLTKYWAIKLGKTQMKAFQSSARTGYMQLELQDDKVLVKSHAVIILEGNLAAFD